MTFTGKIDIATALKKLDDTYDEVSHREKVYGIRFIDRKGTVHELTCRKNVKSPQLKIRGIDSRGRAEVNLQRNGIIMLRDMAEDHPVTPKVCMIFGFKDDQSNDWLRVYH